MAQTHHAKVGSVAIIGAGVSGVAAAIHLRRAGVQATVFERNAHIGGVWVFDERTSKDASYPSVLPSVGDSPSYSPEEQDHGKRHDSPIIEDETGQCQENDSLDFAPPGPCYSSLKNNVSTIEMEMTSHQWKTGTAEFVSHSIMADYIQDAARANQVDELIRLNTRVMSVIKNGAKWKLNLARRNFDALIVANGHYHACNIPEIPGLAEWKRRFPDRVWHSKGYRRPDRFIGQNVLLIGAGTSSTDIAKDLGQVANVVYQSSRGGMYDLPSHLLPDNAARVGGIGKFTQPESFELTSSGNIPGVVTLTSGRQLCEIAHVIVCTGYHVSFPFMRQYHADGTEPEDADEQVLVTNGQVTHNLHKDIWYIPDPTLAFIGVPYHTATFSLFEVQAMAVAAVYSGLVQLPSQAEMRNEYRERVKRKGAGRTLHSLRAYGHEALYVQELVSMADANNGTHDLSNSSSSDITTTTSDHRHDLIKGHSKTWLEAYERRRQRQIQLFAKSRDSAHDLSLLVASCR